MPSRHRLGHSLGLATLGLVLASALPAPAMAQRIAYDSGDDSSSDSPRGKKDDKRSSGRHERYDKEGRQKRTKIQPYIDLTQLVTKEFSPGDDVLTYTIPGVGLDAAIVGARSAASATLRYEHRFGHGKKADDGDVFSGIASGYTTVAPGVTIETGALATRTLIDRGGVAIGGTVEDKTRTNVYSAYVGPSIQSQVGDAEVTGNYRFGYTKIDSPNAYRPAPGTEPVDVFEDSTVHAAEVRAGVRPGEVLPVGIGAGASYYREDISNFDQRIEDFKARVDVSLPVSQSVALVAGVGYEDVEISARDAVRDATGRPVQGSDGGYIVDTSRARSLAYDTSGLIWDAGVVYKPSRRTSFEAHVGRRYGSTSVYGSASYAPNRNSAFSVAVYDNVAGFGGQMNKSLMGLPTDFEAVRNPLSGDVSGCVASLEQGSCVSGSFGSVRSAAFRARGVTASYALDFNRWSAGFGGGYDQRKFITPTDTVLAYANGLVDENYWVNGYLSGKVGERSEVKANLFANWYQTGSGLTGDTTVVGGTASYYHNLTNHLSASAALGLSGLERELPLDDNWNASALVGVRYSF